MRKTLVTTLNVFFVTALLAIAALFFATMLPVPLPGTLGNLEVRVVQSGSMAPAMPVGSLVVTLPAEAYRAGDIITFKQEGARAPTSHRVVSARSQDGTVYYQTKGDANEEPDNREVLHGQVLGRVALTVPYAGFILDFARQPWGFALLIGLPALVIIFDELFNIFGEVRKMRRARGRAAQEARADIRPPASYAWRREAVVRERLTEDIFIYRRVVTLLPRRVPRAAAGMTASLSLFLCATVIAGGVVWSPTSVISYFSDLERSVGNIFQAGVWGAPPPEEDPQLSQTLTLPPEEGEVLGQEAPPEEGAETPPEEPETEPEEPLEAENAIEINEEAPPEPSLTE